MTRETEFAGAQLSRGTVGIRDSFTLLPSLIARKLVCFSIPRWPPVGIGYTFPGPRRDSRSPWPLDWHPPPPSSIRRNFPPKLSWIARVGLPRKLSLVWNYLSVMPC